MSSELIHTLTEMKALLDKYEENNWVRFINSCLSQAKVGQNISSAISGVAGGMGSFSDLTLPGDTQSDKWREDMCEFDNLRNKLYDLTL